MSVEKVEEEADEAAVSVSDRHEVELRMDGGTQAWLQVLASWLVFINTWGLVNSFGVFETYYTENLLKTSSPSAVSWIGSIQLFLLLFCGLFTGRLIDTGRLHWLLVSGTVMAVFGMFMTSLSTKYWQVLLAQGICVGIGGGLLGMTCVAVIPLYFRSKRMVATGIAATGSSVAGIAYSIMLRHLFVQIGFAWAVRVLAFIVLGLLGVACLLMRDRPRPPKHAALISLKQFRDKPYAIFLPGFALMMAATYVPFFYIQTYALKLGIDEDMAFNLLSIMNAASLIGRVAPNFFADKYGGINVMMPTCLFSAILLFFWRFVYDLPGLIVISILYGVISGGMIALPAATIANLTTNSNELGERIGLGFTVSAFGALIGNPVAGACLRPSGDPDPSVSDVQREYQGTWIFGAGLLLAVFGLLTWSRHLKVGLSWGRV